MSEATDKLDALIRELPRMSQRLSFHDKCAAYVAMDRGFPQILVAKAFGVSSGAMSALANCRKENGGFRYQDVRDEYDRLGRDAFHEAFTSNDLVDEIATLPPWRRNRCRPRQNARPRSAPWQMGQSNFPG